MKVTNNNQPTFDIDNDFEETGGKPTFWEKYSNLEITMSKKIEKPVPIISIAENVISSAGNLTMLSGQSKAGKSAFCSVVLAGAIRGHNFYYDGFEQLYIDGNEQKKAVIHIDTEQAKHNHFHNLKNAVLSRVSFKELPKYFKSYNIRETELKDRMSFTKELFKNASALYNGIHLVVIDGIADYIKSVNDEVESNRVVHDFEQLSVTYDCPIILIVHLNPNSNKERGHLGSQLQRKAETVLQVKKDDNDLSYCQPILMRNGGRLDVPIIQFEYDKNKQYHTFSGIKNKQDNQSNKVNKLREIAKNVFTAEAMKSSVAVEKIISYSNVKDRTAKTYIKEMTETYNFIKETKIDNQDKREKYYVSLLG